MAPQRFASVRTKSKPTMLVSFRDDIGVRYEETEQRELPIPIPPPRNPARLSRTYTTFTTTITSPTSISSTTTTTALPAGQFPIPPLSVSPPPTRPLPPIPTARPIRPPPDQHPALRGPPSPALRGPPSPVLEEDAWKRDSGIAATSSSSVTAREEGTENFVYDKLADQLDDDDVTSVYSSDLRSPSPPPEPEPEQQQRPSTPPRPPRPLTLRITTSGIPPPPPMQSIFTESPDSETASPRNMFAMPPWSPTSQAPSRSMSLPKKLSRTFSLRSGAKLRKKNLSESGIAAPSLRGPSLVTLGSVVQSLVTPLEQRRGSRPSYDLPPKFESPKNNPGSTPRMQSPEPVQFEYSSQYSPAASGRTSPDAPFTPLTTTIPSNRLLDDAFLTHLTFSKRGSMVIPEEVPEEPAMGDDEMQLDSAQMEKLALEEAEPHHRLGGDATQDYQEYPANNNPLPQEEWTAPRPPPPPVARPAPPPEIRVSSVDVARESKKVRSLYEPDDGSMHWQDGGGRASPLSGERLVPTEEVPSDEEDNAVAASSRLGTDLSTSRHHATTPRPGSSTSLPRQDSAPRGEHELAGGMEDWGDVSGADVDRYGFIRARPQHHSHHLRPETPDAQQQPEQQLLSPRKRNTLAKKSSDAPLSSSPSSPLGRGALQRAPSRKVSGRSLNTQTSDMSTASRRSARSSIRAAANLLPHNKNRRWMDEAGEMLSMTPGLADIAEDEEAEKTSDALKKKEWERSEKWRKMAKVVRKGKDGQGMEFEFDPKHPKLVERTWKGIPDMWRAAAWYSFLANSARNAAPTTGGAKEEQLVAEFRRLQDVASPDDVQIDLDVPRTINHHIMFRRRYRGGQRLLFRVLHAISLYFPDTGYVQGMASLAATLLCYYDEERCFVMLVRMWQLRGLENLYQAGFAGLMTALKDLETSWLDGKDVARKLADLSIDATAYGTRWYLTLFNLSIPFPAQLRVWDVFMLLGESPTAMASKETTSIAAGTSKPRLNPGPASRAAGGGRGLDILHATSAALIQALREVLLDSDFENAMKALTAWVPIRDEELLMKVVRAEWRQHRAKKDKA